MIPKSCKRLAEVDFPIAEVSRHAVREKSIRHGHPSTLHLWWARRPLASSRAMLMALLLPDPCDPHCPEAFKTSATREIKRFAAHVTRTTGGAERLVADLRSDLYGSNGQKKQAARREADRRQQAWSKVDGTAGWTPPQIRAALLQLIASGASWDFAADETFLAVARNLVKATHAEEPPLVVDPFAGGGSIPLEALRLGCEAFASDLNPVACLILKVMLEDIPRHGPGLAEKLREVGGEIKRQAERELSELYPTDPDGATPIAYLWTRTVRCEAPDCGAEIPLMRSFWLCKKIRRKRALRHLVERCEGKPPTVEFEVFEPREDGVVSEGTVARARATCLCCGAVLPPERVRAQLAAERGGADVIFDAEGQRTGGARMTAVVELKAGQAGRHYRLPTQADYAAVYRSQARLADILGEWEQGGKQGLCPVPHESAPTKDTHRAVGSQLPLYGIAIFGDLFTARQKVALVELLDTVSKRTAAGLVSVLACAFNRVSMSNMSCTRWNAVAEKMQHTFGRQALPMVWDFAEVVITAEAPGNWESGFSLIADVVDASINLGSGQVQLADATDHPLPDQSSRSLRRRTILEDSRARGYWGRLVPRSAWESCFGVDRVSNRLWVATMGG